MTKDNYKCENVRKIYYVNGQLGIKNRMRIPMKDESLLIGLRGFKTTYFIVCLFYLL
jgi:hypothetical protein